MFYIHFYLSSIYFKFYICKRPWIRRGASTVKISGEESAIALAFNKLLIAAIQ